MKIYIVGFIYSLCEYWIGKSKIIVANSFWELFLDLGKWLIRKIKGNK
jgi:hypothetical protein